MESNEAKLAKGGLTPSEIEEIQATIELEKQVLEFSLLYVEHEIGDDGMFYTKLHAPFKTLCHLAEQEKLVLPLKVGVVVCCCLCVVVFVCCLFVCCLFVLVVCCGCYLLLFFVVVVHEFIYYFIFTLCLCICGSVNFRYSEESTYSHLIFFTNTHNTHTHTHTHTHLSSSHSPREAPPSKQTSTQCSNCHVLCPKSSPAKQMFQTLPSSTLASSSGEI